jgi:sugar phosphate isomerase/epimerase
MPADFKIGVMIESFRCGLRGGLQAAANLGVQGVQLYATGGETHFSKLRGSALADLRRMLAEHNLEMAAVCGDFGGHGFQVAEANAARIEDSKRVVELALELNCRVVTTHIGVVPADARHPRYVVMARACAALAQFAASQGVVFAIETGPEPAVVLRGFLDDIGIPTGLGVNFDPANLVMVCREDIPAAVQTLAPYIVHTHAKDGVNRQPVDAEKLYGTFAGDKIDGFCWKDYIQELPLGKGGVPFDAYLSALRQADYHGYLTIEREAGENPHKDIADAVSFLRETMTNENKE